MILVLGTVRLAPENLAFAMPAIEKMVAASRAEDGCVAYSYAQDMLDPHVIHVVEKWRDRATLTAHFAMPHLAEWRAAWNEIGVSDRQLRLFETDEGEAL